MDLNYSQEELAFRDEVRGWLKANLPADLRDKIANYEELTRDDLLRWHKILAKKGWVAPAWPKEWGGTGWNVVQRYIFEEECGFAGTPPLIPFGLSMCAPGAAALRHRRAEEALPAAHLQRRGFLVPGLFRAGLGLRPRLAEDQAPCARATTTSSTARRSGPRSATTPTGSSAWCAPTPAPRSARKASVPADRHEDARHHRAPADPDGRRPRGERGVLRRREGAGGEPGARGRQGLDGGQVPARPRAHEHRRASAPPSASWPS